MNDRRAIALKVKTRATEAGRAFAFHFFLRYGDHTDVASARDCPLARQYFNFVASEVLKGGEGFDDAHRQLLTEYALATVEVAFNERLRALASENATAGVGGVAGFQMEWSRETLEGGAEKGVATA